MSARVLLTGATGHVGGHLLRALREDGVAVRATTRRPGSLDLEPPHEVVQADVLDSASLAPALDGVEAAYYLVHSLDASGSFAERDREAAQGFATAAEEAGVGRIVYLGGIARGDDLSDHLASRAEVGKILRSAAVPTLELRASIVIGAGSLSFETIRNVVDPLPVVTLPEWVKTFSQPIALDDVVAYLRAALEVDLPESRVVEIGGADRVPYLDVMEEYARQAGLSRRFVTVPVPVGPSATSLLPDAATALVPDSVRATMKLVESLAHETLAEDGGLARELFPGIEPVGVAEAIRRALDEERAAA